MHHRVGVVGRENLPHDGGVGNVGLHQNVAVVPKTFLQRIFRGGVGHLVDIDHHVVGVAQQMSHHSGADKSASAG